jgi:hypothetical protein
MYRWYESGGYEHIAAYLAQLDISDFDAKAPPRKTAVFWEIVDTNRAPEDAELADLLEELGRPVVIPLSRLIAVARGELGDWFRDRKNRRTIPHRLETCGYVAVRNDTDKKEGLWRLDGRRERIYGRADRTEKERLRAARALTRDWSERHLNNDH